MMLDSITRIHARAVLMPLLAGQAPGIGFAIGSDTVRIVADDLIEGQE